MRELFRFRCRIAIVRLRRYRKGSDENEKQGDSKREVSGKDAQVIRTFLESVGIYEADALRVGIAIADGKATAESISADDRLALNRYLNSGTDNERLTADNAQGHRLNRAFGLLERVVEFCDKRQGNKQLHIVW